MKWPRTVRRLVVLWLREQKQLRRAGEVIRDGVRGLLRSQLPRMAAAMAYRTIFSLIPVLVVSAVVMGSFMSEDELREQVNELLNYVGLTQIAVEPAPGEELGVVEPQENGQAATERNGEAAGAATAGGEDPATGRLAYWINTLVDRVTGLSFQAIGFVGLLVLIYAAISLLIELEGAFDQIYRATRSRSWVRRITTYWTALTLGVVFLLASFSVGKAVAEFVTSIGRANEEATGWFSRGLVMFAVNVVISTSLLLLAYMAVPNTRVRVRPALLGACLAGVLWELGKLAFTQYVEHAVGRMEQLYGVLALLPLFLLWVYITWIIVLFGLQVSYAMQSFGSRRFRTEGLESVLVDPGLIVNIGLLASERFGAGRTLTVERAARETGLPEATVREFVDAMVRHSVLRQTESEDGVAAYVPARPPERIRVLELLEIAWEIRSGGSRGGSEATDRTLERGLGSRTLADLQRTTKRSSESEKASESAEVEGRDTAGRGAYGPRPSP